MSFYNTGNPVPSNDPRDLDDNAKHIDEVINSSGLTFVDRLGVTRHTIEGALHAADAPAATAVAAASAAQGSATSAAANSARFLSPSATPPTLRNDGSSLQDGDQYQNTTDHLSYTRVSGAWQPLNQSVQQLTLDIANSSDPSKGWGLLGGVRTAMKDAVSAASISMSALRVSVWETQFVMLITSKPTPGNPTTWDWTPAIEAAITYVKTNGGGDVELTAGIYPITRITRRNGVSIIGRGCTATYLQALPFIPSGTAPYGMVEQEAGPVIGSHMRGLHLLGLPASNPNQWGMYLKAGWDAGYVHGGLWMSNHDDVRVTFFNYGIWSRGGYTINNYLRPQQFLEFNQVFIQVMTGGEALRLTGQHGQIMWSGGSVDGRDGQTALRCVTLDYDPDPSTMADNASGQGESTSDAAGTGNSVQAPINVIFGDRYSAQKSQQGFYVQGAKNIVIREGWSEQIGKFLYAGSNSQVVVEKNHLANAGLGTLFGSPGNGYLLSMQANASVIWKSDNEISGTWDNGTDPTMSINNILGVDIGAMSSGGGTAGKFNAASSKVISINSQGFVDTLQHDYVLITPFNADPSVRLRTLNGPAAPGKIVRLRAQGTTFSLGQGTLANISLNGLTGITVPNFGTITLQRIFQVGGSGEWIVLNYPEHYGTAIPTSGYYVAGTKIWNSAPTAGNPLGWVCVTSGIAGSTAVFKAMANLAA
jgi:hypothetical protein